MSKRNSRLAIVIVIIGLFVAASLAVAQQPRTRPQADIKVTYKSTMPGGMESQSTTMIKGSRERSEQRQGYMDQVTITQCDLRRTIQVSDTAKKYMITPMESGAAEGTAPTATAKAAGGSGPSRRGGVITSVITSTDTGERKEMFGFTARHVKTSVRMESSADACNPLNMHIEQDGWYIDLNFGLNCDLGGSRPPVMRPGGGGGCQDSFRSRHVGTGRTGFPLIETTIGYDQNGREQYRTTKEVADLSRQPLDAALFDIPAGYTETNNSQDLYAMNTGAMMQQAMKGRPPTGNADLTTGGVGPASRPGAIRIGVVQLNNRTRGSLATDELRGQLVADISNAGVEAIPLNAISLSEAQAEAKEKQCAYILLTDISSLKTASAGKKLGGLLGRATGVDPNAGKSEAKLDFKLFATGSSAAKLSSTEMGREDGDQASLTAALEREAAAVVAAAQR